jgi:26S proteasome regulatory subunit (ATPase 3-interacting protein)
MVLEYLQRTNRPFSAGDISSNLHNAVSKASVQKILQQLTENGQVVCKTYGKQSIYVIKQESDQIPSKEELQRIDEDIAGLKQEVDALSSEVKQLSSVLNGLTASMTTEQVKEKLERIREENKQYASKLEVLRAGTVMVDADEKKRVEEDYERYRQAWKSRKRMVSVNVNKSIFLTHE